MNDGMALLVSYHYSADAGPSTILCLIDKYAKLYYYRFIADNNCGGGESYLPCLIDGRWLGGNSSPSLSYAL